LKIKIEYIIIVLLVAALLLQWTCSDVKVEGTTITKTEVKWDTIKTETPVYVPKWNTRTEVDIDTFTLPIDTNAILGDYFAIYNYIDTVGTDSVKIVINDSITTNKIASRQVNYKVIYPTITVTKETVINKQQFYYGIGVSPQSIGPKVLYKTKNNHVYGLGVDINTNLNPTLELSMYWKFGK
jgi:hypothetical protein